MIEQLHVKKVAVIQPAAIVDNASWTVVTIDRKGWDHVSIDCLLGAADIAVAALKVQESDASGSGFADVTGLVYGTSNNDTGSASTLPSATDDNLLFGFSIDCRGRKRYLKLVATGGDGAAGSYLAAIATLCRGAQGSLTAAEAGYSQRLVV